MYCICMFFVYVLNMYMYVLIWYHMIARFLKAGLSGSSFLPQRSWDAEDDSSNMIQRRQRMFGQSDEQWTSTLGITMEVDNHR